MMNTKNRSLPIRSFIKAYSRMGNPKPKQEEPDKKNVHGKSSENGFKTRESKLERIEIGKKQMISGVESLIMTRRNNNWNKKQTLKFYRALSVCGTDFQMMETMFKNRTRNQLQAKFRSEDRRNAELVSKALQSQTFDPTFSLSDSEEEDKKPDLQVLSIKLESNSSKPDRKKFSVTNVKVK